MGFNYSLAEVRKFTPRQIHAALHHAQIRHKARMADIAAAVWAGNHCDKKGLDTFIEGLTRDG